MPQGQDLGYRHDPGTIRDLGLEASLLLVLHLEFETGFVRYAQQIGRQIRFKLGLGFQVTFEKSGGKMLR